MNYSVWSILVQKMSDTPYATIHAYKTSLTCAYDDISVDQCTSIVNNMKIKLFGSWIAQRRNADCWHCSSKKLPTIPWSVTRRLTGTRIVVGTVFRPPRSLQILFRRFRRNLESNHRQEESGTTQPQNRSYLLL